MGAYPAQPWHHPYVQTSFPMSSTGIPRLSPATYDGPNTLGHCDLEGGFSCLCQLSSTGCHGTLVLLQAKAKTAKSSPGTGHLLGALEAAAAQSCEGSPGNRAAEEGANSPLSSCSPLPLAFRESDTLVSEITLACCQAKQQFPHYPPERNQRGPRKKSRGLSFKVSLVCHLGKAKFLESTA